MTMEALYVLDVGYIYYAYVLRLMTDEDEWVATEWALKLMLEAMGM